MRRVSSEDLDFAAEWLSFYEDERDGADNARMQAVAEWLRQEATRRREASVVRRIRAAVGPNVPLDAIRRRLSEVLT